ncbi:hypothetical protein ACWEIJ_20710 [Lentzea sp. NPDC004789]
MNLTDLSEVLHARAELPDSAHDARMAGVRARVAATRRRRAVAGVACVVLALVGIVYAVLPGRGPSPEPAVPPRSLPEYQSGTRLTAQAWGDLPSTSVTVRFVPKSLDLKVFTQCDVGDRNRALLVTVTVNDRPLMEQSSCGGATMTPDWSPLGVVVGQPTVITLTVLGEQGEFGPGSPSLLPLPARGAFALGVGETVPVNEYSFPPRPPTLQNINEGRLGPITKPLVKLQADPADPTAAKEATVAWPGGHSLLLAHLNTPGRIRVLVNDIQFIDLSCWTYSVCATQAEWPSFDGDRRGLSEGQSVKITAIPERTTGDWDVTLVPR